MVAPLPLTFAEPAEGATGFAVEVAVVVRVGDSGRRRRAGDSSRMLAAARVAEARPPRHRPSDASLPRRRRLSAGRAPVLTDGVREAWLRGRRFGRSYGVTERSARSIDDEVIGDVKDVARLIAVQAGDQGACAGAWGDEFTGVLDGSRRRGLVVPMPMLGRLPDGQFGGRVDL